MAKSFGQMTSGATAGSATLSADGAPEYIIGGATIDWSTVPANAADTTLADGQIIPAGVKFLPFGCILAKITASGLFGPHQAGATADGRQTLSKGDCFCLNQTIREDDSNSQFAVGAIEGGAIYQSRLKKANDAGSAFVAYAVITGFNTAFPRFRLAEH